MVKVVLKVKELLSFLIRIHQNLFFIWKETFQALLLKEIKKI